jgi:hypothetical protein
MSSYNELIKNFERVRSYMREFYVYGFKSRADYDNKSARSYDDEKRRMESILGDYMSFVRTPEGKNVFLSIDSRTSVHNPFYKALKAKSFTDGDITLHFIIFDILYSPSVEFTLAEIMEIIDEKYLSGFDVPMMFDESTIRKKLKEYCEVGIVEIEKVGRKAYYHRADTVDISNLIDVTHYFSEVSPCGVIGSYILDKFETDSDAFTFKHHYITSAIDSGVLAALFTAMREKRIITVDNLSRRKDVPRKNRIIPLRVFISVQSGRQHLFAYHSEFNCFISYRIDYLSNVKLEETTPRFDELRSQLDRMQTKMWGVSAKRSKWNDEKTEHVEFVVEVADDEYYIINRLNREKRVGTVEKTDEHTYRFSADVYDIGEMVPWIRTFICRIKEIKFSNRELEKKFKEDLDAMYKMYGVDKGEDI